MQTKKLSIAQSILQITNPEVLVEIEQFLKTKNISVEDNSLKRKAVEELSIEITTSISDIEAANYKTAADLLADIKHWK